MQQDCTNNDVIQQFIENIDIRFNFTYTIRYIKYLRNNNNFHGGFEKKVDQIDDLPIYKYL